MLGEKHDLIHELPEYREKIHALKLSNHHFARLFEQYHAADHQVLRMEEGVETPSDVVVEEAKKKRLKLKDELVAMLKA